MNDSIDVLIVCALHDEYKALLEVTDGLINERKWQESYDSNGWTIANAIFETPLGNLSVRASWQAFMGREYAILTTNQLLMDTSAKCIAMCGVCAGRRGKINLGDVVFADRMWSYDNGKKIVEEGVTVFKGDILPYVTDRVWLQRMQSLVLATNEEWMKLRPKLSLENQENWVIIQLHNNFEPHKLANFNDKCPDWTQVIQRLLKREWVTTSLILTETGITHAKHLNLLYPNAEFPVEPFATEAAPIATGSAVVEDVSIFEQLETSMRKVLAIDMEASGLAALGSFKGVPVIVAKGVQDFGDTFKDDRYRHFAARAAAECLVKLLRNSVDLIKPRTTQIALTDEDLISTLAELFPDIEATRAVWERAGGKRSQVENIIRPEDLWQRMWKKSEQGASVTPKQLLQAALVMAPNNTTLQRRISQL